jgi:hypothetical protein
MAAGTVKHLLFAFVLAAGTPAIVAAQLPPQSSPVDSGREVRVTTFVNHEQLSGRLLARYARSDAELQLCTSFQPCRVRGDSAWVRHIPTAQLLRLEVRKGDHAMTGFIAGGVTGAVLVGLFSAGLNAAFCEESDCGSSAGPLLRGGLIGGVTFGFIGGMIGTLFPKWGPAQ